jgi:hypothetical protein
MSKFFWFDGRDSKLIREVQFSFTSWVNTKSSFQPTIEGTYGYASFQYGKREFVVEIIKMNRCTSCEIRSCFDWR